MAEREYDRRLLTMVNNYKVALDVLKPIIDALTIKDIEVQALVAVAVRFMLFRNYEKPGVPVKRQELVDVITEKYRKHRQVKQLPRVVIAMAQLRILSTMGLEMSEYNRFSAQEAKRQRSAADGDVAGTKTYKLVTALPAPLRQVISCASNADSEHGFLMVILSVICLSRGYIPTEQLWSHLSTLGIDHEGSNKNLGMISEVMKKFEAKRYVVKEIIREGGAEVEVFKWGEVAEREFQEAEVKAFVEREVKRSSEMRQEARGGDVVNNGDDDDDDDDDCIVVSD